MINIDEIKEGQHFWAISNNKLLIVGYFDNGFEVCGPWECGISYSEIELIEEINIPKGFESTRMYYGE